MPKITKNSNLAPYMELASLESISPKESDIEKVNKFTVAPLTDEDVRIYQALLIDDQVTRNSTHYPADFQKAILSLPAGEGNFVGAPILFGDDKDHKEAAAAQVGRIFDAWQVTDSTGHIGVMAKFYVPKEHYGELIGKIDSGVLKEVSISTKVELPICSVCHQDIRTCGHTMGKEGCHVTMTGKGFCAEVSLVAVPGSSQAKILNANAAAKYSPLEMMEAVRGLIREELAKFSESPVIGSFGKDNKFKKLPKVEGSGPDAIKAAAAIPGADPVATMKQGAANNAPIHSQRAKEQAAASIRAGKPGDAISQLGEGVGNAAELKVGFSGPDANRPGLGKAASGAIKTSAELGAGITDGAIGGATKAAQSAAKGAASGALKGGIPGATTAGVAGAAKGLVGNIGTAAKGFLANPTVRGFGTNLGAGLAAFAIWEGGRALVNKFRDRKKGKTQESTTVSFKEGMMGDFFKKLKDVAPVAGGAAKTGLGKLAGGASKVLTASIPRSIPGIIGYSALGTAVSMGVSSLINKFVTKKQERDEEKRARQVTMRGAESLSGSSYKESFDDNELELMTELGFSIGDIDSASDEEIDELIELLNQFKANLDEATSLSDDDKEILLHFGVTEDELQYWNPDDVDELVQAFMDERGIKPEDLEDEPEVKATEGLGGALMGAAVGGTIGGPLALAAGALVGSLLYKAYTAKSKQTGQPVPPVVINIQGPAQTMQASPTQNVAVNPWRPIMSYRMSFNDYYRESTAVDLQFTKEELTFLQAIGLDAKEASELTPEQLDALIALLEGHKHEIEGTPDAPGLTPVEEPVVKSTESLEQPVVAEIDTLLGLDSKMDEAYTTIATMAGKYGVEFNIGTSQVNQDDKFAMSDKYFNRLQDMDLTLRNIEAKLGITPDVTAAYEDNGDNRSKVAYISQKLDNVMKRVYTLKGRIGMEDASKLELTREAIRAGVLAGTIAVGTQDDAERLFRNMSVAEIKKTTEAFTEKAKTAFWSVKEVVQDTPNKPKSDRQLAEAITNRRK
jgi:hypothetical protein